MKLAITGATGFVGGRLLRLAIEDGHEVMALTRRSQNERHGVTWVQGALDNRQALQRLVTDADAVIHPGTMNHASMWTPWRLMKTGPLTKSSHGSNGGALSLHTAALKAWHKIASCA